MDVVTNAMRAMVMKGQLEKCFAFESCRFVLAKVSYFHSIFLAIIIFMPNFCNRKVPFDQRWWRDLTEISLEPNNQQREDSKRTK